MATGGYVLTARNTVKSREITIAYHDVTPRVLTIIGVFIHVYILIYIICIHTHIYIYIYNIIVNCCIYTNIDTCTLYTVHLYTVQCTVYTV